MISMRYIIIFLSILFTSFAIAEDAWLIIPDKLVGQISKDSSFEELQQAYGVSNVIKRDIDIGEGQMTPGIVIYPNDEQKKLELLLEADGQISYVQLNGDLSLWHTEEGIALGTSLKELEIINKGSFSLAGFGWDYSGTVYDWFEGILTKYDKPERALYVRLRPDTALNSGKLQGDKAFSSKNDDMQSVNPKIYSMIIKL